MSSTATALETARHAVDGYAKVDELREVRDGLVGRDTLYRLIAERRIPGVVRLSTRRLLVPTNWMERMAALDDRTEKPHGVLPGSFSI